LSTNDQSCTALNTGFHMGRDSDLLRAGRSGDRTPVGAEIFRSRADRTWGPPSLLCSGYRVFPRG